MTHSTGRPSAALTVLNSLAGDRNPRGMAGARAIGIELETRLAMKSTVIGQPRAVLGLGWREELTEAVSALGALARHYDDIYASGLVPVTALNRCAGALATLPVVARHHPEAVVVWLDAHADMNTPHNTLTGYLGGLALSGPLGLWESGLGAGLLPANVVLVGARDIDPPERSLLQGGLVRLVPPGPGLVEELRRVLADRPAYLHLDCDVLEPGIVPTEYSVPNGLSLAELRAVAELLATSRVVGLEVAEFEASWADDDEPASPSSLLDALMPAIDAANRAG